MKRLIVSRGEEGEVIVRLPWSSYPLLGFLVFIILLFLSALLSAISAQGTSPMILVDLSSGILVFGTAFALYAGAFQTGGNRVDKLHVFKLRWIQEVLLLTGIFGAILGTLFMSTGFSATGGEDQAVRLGSGMATALISFLYGLLGFTGFFFIEKHLSTKVIAEQFESRTIKSGFNFRSMLGLLLFIFMLFLVILMIYAPGIDRVDILFNLPVACLMIAVAMLSLLIYGRKTMLHVVRVPFWRANHDEDRLLSLIQAARGSKRIIALLGLATVALTPIVLLSGWGGTDVPGAVPLIKTATILLWCLFMVLYLTLAEAQVVQQVYFQTGIIPHEDRFFIFKFILPSLFLVSMLAWFNLIWVTATST